MAVTALDLQGLYLAYFGRPADVDGLGFYTSHAEMDMWKVAQAFSESPESQSLYGPVITADVIDSIYMNLFNRHAEADGLSYWMGEVTSGRLTAGEAAFGILLGAQNEDKVTVANKLAVGAAFTDALADVPPEAYMGDAAAAYARAFIHGVDGTEAAKSIGVGLAADTVAAMQGELSPAGTTQVVENQLRQDYVFADDVATGVVLSQGLWWMSNATVGNLHSGSTVELAGAGRFGFLDLELASDTASDLLRLKVNADFPDDNDTTSDGAQERETFTTPGVEHLRIESTGHLVTDLSAKVEGWQADNLVNQVVIHDDALQSIRITGDQPIDVVHGDSVRIVDASELNASATTFIGYPYHAAFEYSAPLDGAVETIIGSTSSTNFIQGSYGANLIVGGSQADTLTGAGGGDTITGGGGDDTFWLPSSKPGDPVDTISDFSGGDVIDLSFWAGVNQLHTIAVSVVASEAEALQAIGNSVATSMKAAFDSSTGMLYVDVGGDGSADMQVKLLGVETITEASFTLQAKNA